jgi:hypothetical protein
VTTRLGCGICSAEDFGEEGVEKWFEGRESGTNYAETSFNDGPDGYVGIVDYFALVGKAITGDSEEKRREEKRREEKRREEKGAGTCCVCKVAKPDDVFETNDGSNTGTISISSSCFMDKYTHWMGENVQ